LAAVVPDGEHVRFGWRGLDDPPQVERGAITDKRWLAARKQRGLFGGESRQGAVSNRVDASVKRVECS
jgi:hypothetical protein